MSKRMKAIGSISPVGIGKSRTRQRYDLYKEEKKLLKEEFSSLGDVFDWNDPTVQKKLREFSRQIITTTQKYMNQSDLVEQILPAETVEPGDTYVLHELHGVNIYEGTYGASVRMSRPQFTKYEASPNLKEVGLKLDLVEIRTGKYSASELSDYTTGLISAWRNHLLFVTTLAGMSAYQSGGAQYQAGTSIAFGTMDAAFETVADDGDVAVIIGRRNAIHKLSNMSGWGETAKDEFEFNGQVGKYGGAPVVKVNSFTDPDYGTVYPMPSNELWLFSELPAGRAVFADRLRTADEIIAMNETMNLYFRWDDALGIFYTDRIGRVAAIT